MEATRYVKAVGVTFSSLFCFFVAGSRLFGAESNHTCSMAIEGMVVVVPWGWRAGSGGGAGGVGCGSENRG